MSSRGIAKCRGNVYDVDWVLHPLAEMHFLFVDVGERVSLTSFDGIKCQRRY